MHRVEPRRAASCGKHCRFGREHCGRVSDAVSDEDINRIFDRGTFVSKYRNTSQSRLQFPNFWRRHIQLANMSATQTLVEPPTVATPPRCPPVPEFDASKVTVEEILQGLAIAGGVLLRKAVATQDVHQIEADVRPWLDADRSWEGGFFPKETRRAYALASKSKHFIDKFVKQPLFQGVVNTVLTTTDPAWTGATRSLSTSKPQINSTVVFSIGPGARAQDLHRDDMIHHNYPLKAITPTEHTFRREMGVGFFVAGKRTTKANGATRFIPGSHLWDTEIPPDDTLASYAELEPGDGFIMYSSCYHGGSANTTVDEERLLYACFMTRGYLRQVGPRSLL
jgi:ectoine hydroxylase-related dioxygenase (phytanoyl-CoA dioxygenase family)